MPEKHAKRGRIGRPPSKTADSHSTIIDAVHFLLQQTSVRDLTMEAIAKRAGVGKPTLYKWWPSKAALILTMVQERMVGPMEPPGATSAEEANRALDFCQSAEQFFGSHATAAIIVPLGNVARDNATNVIVEILPKIDRFRPSGTDVSEEPNNRVAGKIDT